MRVLTPFILNTTGEHARTLADCVNADVHFNLMSAAVCDSPRNLHVVSRAAAVVCLKLRSPTALTLNKTSAVSSHARNVNAHDPWLCCDGLPPVSLFPTLMCDFQPLFRDKNVFAHFGELAQDFLSEKVFGAIPLALKLKVVKLCRGFFFSDFSTPVRQLVLNPLIVNLTRNDGLFLNDVRGCQAVQTVFVPTVSFLRAGSVADCCVGVEDNQDS